jgi:hypothetical protein
MLSFVLLMGLLQLPTQGVSPCTVEKTKIAQRGAPLTIEQICRVENRMSLLKDGMSWNTAMKTLGISRKHLMVTAHGALWHRYLGSGYELVSPFSLPGTAMRLLLLDREGKVVKDVHWH